METSVVIEDFEKRSLIRVLDANANRVAEACRVLEDVARFLQDDAPMSEAFKSIRHAIRNVVDRVAPCSERLESRDTNRDVGTTIGLPSEYDRSTVHDLVAANSQRLQQAMRVLEEVAKALMPHESQAIEQLRYRCYSLEKDLISPASRSRHKVQESSLCVLVDGRSSQSDFMSYARDLFQAGADMLQLRDKQMSEKVLLERALGLVQIANACGGLAIVNDRPDIALLARAHGVHVGQDELPIAAARSIVGGGRLVGFSTHSTDQAEEAEGLGADYLGIGPVFPSPTKAFESFLPPEVLREVARKATIPVFAIGGIGYDNLGVVLELGIRRIAVTSAVHSARDPIAATERLKARLNEFPVCGLAVGKV